MPRNDPSDARRLAECYVISLRPVAEHGAMRRAAAAHGAKLLALSPWKIVTRDDAASRAALRAALSASHVIVTSPAAARAAAARVALRARPEQAWLAVGAGTALALRRCGIGDVASPARMDSEGLLGLPALRHIRGATIGLLTAPGGRNQIAPELQARGAHVLRADVYERVPVAFSTRALNALRQLRPPFWLAVSSGEALERTLATLPDAAAAQLRHARVVAASERLATLARSLGFTDTTVAADARPRSLLDAAASRRGASSRRAR